VIATVRAEALVRVCDKLAVERVLAIAAVRDIPSPALDLMRRVRQRRSGMCIELGRLPVDVVATMVQACVADADASLIGRVQDAAEACRMRRSRRPACR
jgi:hypothetical protein